MQDWAAAALVSATVALLAVAATTKASPRTEEGSRVVCVNSGRVVMDEFANGFTIDAGRQVVSIRRPDGSAVAMRGFDQCRVGRRTKRVHQ